MAELSTSMAALDICDIPEEGETQSEISNQRYSLRKRTSSVMSECNSKRRCSLQPTKLNTLNTPKAIADYYLNKRPKMRLTKLETIFEDPRPSKAGVVTYVGKTVQRKIMFNKISKAKSKQRKLKHMKLKKTKSVIKTEKKRLTMEEFLARLHNLMEFNEKKEK